VTFADDPAAPPRLFDSAFAVDRDGRFVDRYDKSHLVPFGEYLPLRALLGRFVRAVATGSAGRDASPGPRPRRVDLPLDPPLAVGVPICFELIFPDLVRRFAADGAGLLLGITNDAWYGRTGAPLQFLSITAMRSAETGLWGARAANSGVSGFIDQRGRIVARTGIFERDLMVVDVPVASAGQSPTFYVRTGDWLPAACWVTSATLVGIALAGGRRRADPARPPPGAEARGRANPIRESSRGAK
jgi:apolipoprotein N-acyltransferase